MSNFELEEIPEFSGTIRKVCKLVRDKKCLLDDFINDISGTNEENELGTLYQIVEDVANCKQHPKAKKLNLGKNLDGYEAKSSHLRLYYITEKVSGIVLVIGGRKKNQDQDIERLKKIIKQYQKSAG